MGAGRSETPNAAGKVCPANLRHLILEQASPETAEEVMQRNRWEGGREGGRARKRGSRGGRRQVEKPVVSEDVGWERERESQGHRLMRGEERRR